jgi:hypothetical protein
MHSTKLKFMESIERSGFLPGGLTRGRIDVFADANDFANDAYYGKIWKDPVRDVHMRLESNVILFIPGTLLMQEDVVLYRSNDTGDYLTPCVIPPRCIISAKQREHGKVGHIEPKDVYRSAIYAYLGLCWFATGKCAQKYAYPPDHKKKETKPPLPPPVAEPSPSPIRESSKARGSNYPSTPRSDSTRTAGAEKEQVSLKEAPWRMVAERGFNPPSPVPPERVAERKKMKESKNKMHIPEAKEKPQEEWEEF